MSKEEKKAIMASMLEDAKALFEKYREYVPEGGFISIGCWADHLHAYVFGNPQDGNEPVLSGWENPQDMKIYETD